MKHHRPSAVLEMPKGQLLWCIVCSKPWPCPDASGESATEVGRIHDPLCVLSEPCDEETPEHGYCGFSAPLYCIHCHQWCICERLEKARADEREKAAQRVAGLLTDNNTQWDHAINHAIRAAQGDTP